MGSEQPSVLALAYVRLQDDNRRLGNFATDMEDKYAASEARLSAQEEQIARLRGLLKVARDEIDYWADTAVEYDLIARIDAALEGSKRDG